MRAPSVLRRRPVHLVLALALALAGCGTAARSAAPSGSPVPTVTPVRQAVEPVSPDPAGAPDFARFYGQHPDWTSCQQIFECTHVSVPVDWTAPAGATIELALMRLPATDRAHRIGSLLINPGGPGGSGLELVQAAKEIYSDALRARYDIVGFDPRGVGSSAPVQCLSAVRLNAFLTANSIPNTPAEIATLVSGAKEFADGCRARSGALLSHVGTRDVVRDLDVLRATLGQDRLDWFGFSYGTYIGSFYAGMFPSRVGRMVLDGPLDPTLGEAAESEMQAAGFQDEFDRFADNCVHGGRCAIGSSRQAISDAVSALFARLATAPQRTASGRVLTETDALTGVIASLYARDSWDSGVAALAEAFAGRGDPLLGLADQLFQRLPDGTFQNNSDESNYAVNCLDHPGDTSVAEAEAELPVMKAASPVFGASFAWGNLPCAGMPLLDPPPVLGPIRAVGAAPILVVGTTHDPATPYPWARALAGQLTSAVLLTREGDGHTGYHRGNKCVDAAVDAYLLAGTMPKVGTRC